MEGHHVTNTRHVEREIHPARRLGWKPKDPDRDVLRLGDFLTGVMPSHPASVDYFQRITSSGGWLLGRNDEFGTCGPTSFANLLLLVSTWLADAPIKVTDDDIIDLYRRSGNPDFDPATGAGDNGVDMTVMLSAAIKGGIGKNFPLAFAAVDSSDPSQEWAAGALFGGTLWGADLDVAQQHQTDVKLWDYVPGSGTWGGHAIMAAGRYTDAPGTTTDRTGLVTWQTPIDSTDTFITRQVRERYVVVFPWHLGSKQFQAGVNVPALAAAYTALTGKPFPQAPTPTPPPAPTPTPPGPTPAPTPTGDPLDVQLVKDLGTWPTDHHVGANRSAAEAIQRWRTAKHL
jgi:hypothetical protein